MVCSLGVTVNKKIAADHFGLRRLLLHRLYHLLYEFNFVFGEIVLRV